MTTAVGLLRELASTLKTVHREPNDISIESRDEIIRKLQTDFEGSTRAETLQGLCDILGSDLRPAVAKVLDSVPWEILGLLLGSLEQSSSPSSLNGSDIDPESPSPASRDGRGGSTRVSKEATLSERLVLEMAEIFSPKELHIIALEHLHAYSGERTVRAILTVLRRSTERMPPVQRAKFLGAAMQPALRATRQMTEERVGLETRRVAATEGKSLPNRNDSPDKLHDESQNESGRGKNSASAANGERQHLLMEEEELPSYEAYAAAAAVANAAVDFVGPLLEQASAERVRAHNQEASVPAADRAGPTAGTTVDGVAGNLAASDLSLVAYLGFALAALEAASETSACVASSAAAAHDASSAPGGGAPPATVLARAEERMVALVVGAPAIDLRFILLHGCRLSYANRIKRRQSEREGVEETEHVKQTAPRRESARLGELALSGAMPWTLRGVSCLAHLVACHPKLRDRWLPLVWSRGTEHRLFLPHAQELMRARSKRVASKGLELTCFVAERLGRHPDEAGAFPFEWQPSEETDDDVSNHRDNDRALEDREVVDDVAHEGTRCRRLQGRRYFKPFYLDLADFLQVLIDVMVSCAVPSLRARGHSAVSAFLSAADEASRFRVLKRLIERCPWPNATGLLLDTFRREMDRAFRCASNPPSSVGVTEKESCSACYCAQGHPRSLLGNGDRNELDRAASVDAGPPSTGVDAPGGKPRVTAGRIASPFASAQAGKFVREQLRRACRKGPPMSLLMDMDSRTGGLALARYAHALDRLGGSGSCRGRGRGGGTGQLELRRPDILRETVLLVQGFLDDLQGATVTSKGAGPEYFRLFILEDACQQCLQELQR